MDKALTLATNTRGLIMNFVTTIWATTEACAYTDVTTEDMSNNGDYYPAYDVTEYGNWYELTPEEIVPVLAYTMTCSARTKHDRKIARLVLKKFGPEMSLCVMPLSVIVKAARMARKLN